eukprot:c11386_g1_i1.p1 GENE.c11386_g1_i1~~c11386_g1_i1.p1  ORF type:complete len:246 (+),score=62.39 c11386_g1_i1:35-772(+)
MRRAGGGAGIRGIRRTEELNKAVDEMGGQLAETQITQLQDQMKIFKQNLEEFALKYRNEIKRNPVFRMHFQQMCAQIGVDPLASNKGFWAEILGVGHFYFELGVQILDVCLKTRANNGGLITFPELLQKLQEIRGSNAQQIDMDDLDRSIKKLEVLGGGMSVITLSNGTKLLRSVPCELTTDHAHILNISAANGYITREMLSPNWDATRIDAALHNLMEEGMVWIDTAVTPHRYWFPCHFFRQTK